MYFVRLAPLTLLDTKLREEKAGNVAIYVYRKLKAVVHGHNFFVFPLLAVTLQTLGSAWTRTKEECHIYCSSSLEIIPFRDILHMV